MPKEDYLLKYIEKLSRVIAAMLGLREKGLPEDAIRLADETYKELLNVDLNDLSTMPLAEFTEVIRKVGYSSTYIEALAKISHETANAYQAQNKPDLAQNFYTKSLHIYYLLNEKDKTFSFEREMIISELKELTNNNE